MAYCMQFIVWCGTKGSSLCGNVSPASFLCYRIWSYAFSGAAASRIHCSGSSSASGGGSWSQCLIHTSSRRGKRKRYRLGRASLLFSSALFPRIIVLAAITVSFCPVHLVPERRVLLSAISETLTSGIFSVILYPLQIAYVNLTLDEVF